MMRPAPVEGVEDVDAARARELIDAGEVRILDVREPGEHVASHIPGSRLLPLASLRARIGELDPEASWLVHCEHGVRSLQAVRIMKAHGFRHLFNLADGLAAWDGPRADHRELFGDPAEVHPNAWLMEHIQEIGPPGGALDLACGGGRNALALAYFAWKVTAVDARAAALDELRARAEALDFPIETLQWDLEEHGLPDGKWDLICGVHYLQRDLFPAIRHAVRPGGRVIWETFTTAQADRGEGGPTDPEHLLQPGELEAVFRGWEIEASREGEAAGEGRHARRFVAGILARKPAGE